MKKNVLVTYFLLTNDKSRLELSSSKKHHKIVSKMQSSESSEG